MYVCMYVCMYVSLVLSVPVTQTLSGMCSLRLIVLAQARHSASHWLTHGHSTRQKTRPTLETFVEHKFSLGSHGSVSLLVCRDGQKT